MVVPSNLLWRLVCTIGGLVVNKRAHVMRLPLVQLPYNKRKKGQVGDLSRLDLIHLIMQVHTDRAVMLLLYATVSILRVCGGWG